MTKHERIILEKLVENPMLSQSELAEMLGLTRSSVSVYISHLMQMGFIRGRGYVIENCDNLYVIGTAGVDHRMVMEESRLLQPDSATILDDCELTVSYGGIAKNVSENLCRLGGRVSCICAVGSDVQGRELLDECRLSGVDIDDVLIVPASRSSTYLEIASLDRNRIIFSSANMKLQRQITPEFLMTKQHKLRHAKGIITEDSLSTAALQYISSNYSPVFLICSKSNRVGRYAQFLNQFNGIVANLETAWMTLGEEGKPPLDDASVFSVIERVYVRAKGPILLCYGSNHFAYCDGSYLAICSYSDPKESAALYAYYRDTVAAGFFHCLMEGIEKDDLMRYVCACREIVSQSPALVNLQICPELISSVISSKDFSIRHNRLH